MAHDELIKMIRDGLKRIVAKPKKRKELITPEMLLRIVELFSLPPSLTELRLGCAYAGFLRIVRSTVVMSSSHLMEWSSTSRRARPIIQAR